MALTTKTLIDTFLQTEISANDLLVHFESILQLRKKYGKQLFTPRIMDSIKEVEPTTHTIIQILAKYNKDTLVDIKYLISYIKKNVKTYIPNFVITSPTKNQTETVTKQIHKRFPDSSVSKKDTIDLGITIAWEWWHYKRNLDQDIQKLLG